MRAASCSLPSLSTSATARQASRQPASACHSLLTPRRSDSSAHSQFCRAPLAPPPRASTVGATALCAHTHSPYALVAGRPPPARLSQHNHEQARPRQQSTLRPRGLCLPIVRCPILGPCSLPSFVPCTEPLSLRTKRPRPPPYAIAHSSPARAEHRSTFVNSVFHV